MAEKIIVYEMRIWSKPRLHDLTEAAAVYGEGGWVLVHNTGWKAFDDKNKVVKEANGGGELVLHVRNFLDCMRSRRRDDLNQEIYQGRMILVRNVWSDITPDSGRFEQAFSDDGGKTWEVNWIAVDTRVK